MRFLLTLTVFTIILSCNNRTGIPEADRQNSNTTFNPADSSCMTASDGIFVFKKITADTVANAIHAATQKYFGEAFSTKIMQDSIHNWLANEFFSGKTYLNKDWKLNAVIDQSKLSCNYKTLYSLEKFDIDLYYENKICLKKLIQNLGQYTYTEKETWISLQTPKNRLRFLCDFYVDIRYKPKSLFSSAKIEQYRITIKDTVDMFTTLGDSAFVYR
jgi:hypothetical protein